MGLRHLSAAEFTEYADGSLPESKIARIEEHLRRCASCSEALAKTQLAIAAASRMEAVAVPGDLRRRVAAKAAGQPVPEVRCGEASALIHEHIDGLLAPALAGALHRHLRACARCRAEFAALSAAVRLVRSLRTVTAPARVREAVAAARREPLRPAPWGVRLRPALAVAAVIALGVLLAAVRPGTPRAASPPQIARAPIAEPAPPQPAPAPTASRPEPSAERDQVAVADAGAVSPEAPPAPIVRASAGSRREPTVERPAALPTAKGTLAGATTVATAAPITLPAALRTLKAVAESAAHEREAQQAMVLAGERFATLDSEAVLARLPELPARRTPAEPARSSGADNRSAPGLALPESGKAGQSGAGDGSGRAATSPSTPVA